jgi:PPE-repeat protein
MNAQSFGKYGFWLISLTAAAFVLTVSSWAQDASGFSSLQKHINKQVTVETQNGTVSGQLLRVEENRLVVYQAGGPQSISRESVKKVTRHKSRHTAAWVVGASGAGLALGFLGGMHAFDDTRNANTKIATVTAVEGGVGAAVGYGLSRIGKKDQVVYQQE